MDRTDNHNYNNMFSEENKVLQQIIKTSFFNPKMGIIIHKHQTVKSAYTLKKEDIVKLLDNEGIVLETFSKKDIYHALAEFKYHNIPIVGFVGDNRSLPLIISSMIELHGENNMPLFIPFRGIHKNTIALDVGLDKDIGVIINRIKKHYIEKDISKNMKYIERNTLKITIRESTKPLIDGYSPEKPIKPYAKDKKEASEKITEVYYGFMFSIGAIYKIMKLYYEGDDKVINSIKTFSRAYLSLLMNSNISDHLLSKDICKIKLLEEKINHQRFLVILISSLDKLIDNYQPFSNIKYYNKASKNSSFNFMAADLDRGELLRGLPFFIHGRYGKLEKEAKVISNRVPSVNIETNAGILLDGELIKPYMQKKVYIIDIKSGPIIKFPVL